MNDKIKSTEEIVARYLRRNPDFLINNPSILEFMQLHHASGPAVSLIERQVEHLRKQNRDMDRKLSHLVQMAEENQRLMSRLHQLTLELMVMNSLSSFFDHLSQALMNEFNADILNITLFDRKKKIKTKTPIFHMKRDDAGLKQFEDKLQKGETVCGRLNSDKLEFLFGKRAPWVQSTALVPLGADGMLAIGSSDEARFYPGMGTLFLDLLANIVTSRLAIDEPEEQRRTA
jgi:uncharacterized protein YigA (DUF484 family)